MVPCIPGRAGEGALALSCHASPQGRGIVSFNVSPRYSTQVTSAMKTGQGGMIGFFFSEENTSSRRVILKIELELSNINTIVSLSAVTLAVRGVSDVG